MDATTPDASPPCLSAIIAARRAGRIATTPESFRNLLTQSHSGNCSPRVAIKAQCAECNGFDRDAIRDCTAYACPLWQFRPYQQKGQP